MDVNTEGFKTKFDFERQTKQFLVNNKSLINEAMTTFAIPTRTKNHQADLDSTQNLVHPDW